MARSAVLTPADFAFPHNCIRAEADANVQTVLVCDLDLADLQTARLTGSVTPRSDRRPDLFSVVKTRAKPIPEEVASKSPNATDA